MTAVPRAIRLTRCVTAARNGSAAGMPKFELKWASATQAKP